MVESKAGPTAQVPEATATLFRSFGHISDPSTFRGLNYLIKELSIPGQGMPQPNYDPGSTFNLPCWWTQDDAGSWEDVRHHLVKELKRALQEHPVSSEKRRVRVWFAQNIQWIRDVSENLDNARYQLQQDLSDQIRQDGSHSDQMPVDEDDSDQMPMDEDGN
ncbi:hypothetical protein BC834DRAFT_975409 [Gloeopeniophorella convolvens]|nr:hypothetical protein BC834DRAFT_975409 [Gloeopeniophorella convolvens]